MLIFIKFFSVCVLVISLLSVCRYNKEKFWLMNIILLFHLSALNFYSIAEVWQDKWTLHQKITATKFNHSQLCLSTGWLNLKDLEWCRRFLYSHVFFIFEFVYVTFFQWLPWKEKISLHKINKMYYYKFIYLVWLFWVIRYFMYLTVLYACRAYSFKITTAFSIHWT